MRSWSSAVLMTAVFFVVSTSAFNEVVYDLPNPDDWRTPYPNPELSSFERNRLDAFERAYVFRTSVSTVPQTIRSSDIVDICTTLSTWETERGCFESYIHVLANDQLSFVRDMCVSNNAESAARCYRDSFSREKHFSYGRNRFEEATIASCGVPFVNDEAATKCYRVTLRRLQMPAMRGLINIADVCSYASAWERERKCYEMYLRNSRSLSEVQLARAAISGVGDSYDDVGRGKIARDVVAKMSSLYPYLKRGTEMCLMLSTWPAEIRCHDNLLFRADDFSHHPGRRAQVLTESCSYQNLAEARAKCLGRAVELFVRGGKSYKDICSSKTSWPDEEKCYKAVIDRFIR